MQPLKDGVLAETINVSEVAFRALQTGYCTYRELDSVLSLEDALNLIEVSQVASYNKEKIEYFSRQE